MKRIKHWARDILAPAAVLLLFSAIGALLLSGTYQSTAPAIEQAERAIKNQLLAQTLPPGSFDNDLSRALYPLPADPLLGLKRPANRYLATRSGQVSGVILEARAPDGYAGEIRLLIGILPDGRIGGVRVTAHHETPGLGDYIEVVRSPWIRQFDGTSLDRPDMTHWKVRKDGGPFDYVTGATVTPRAIVKAVHGSLRYFAAHRAELLSAELLSGEAP